MTSTFVYGCSNSDFITWNSHFCRLPHVLLPEVLKPSKCQHISIVVNGHFAKQSDFTALINSEAKVFK